MTNQQTNTPDDIKLLHLGKIAKARREKALGDKELREAYARADAAGLDIKAEKIAHKIASAKEPASVIATLQEAIRYAQMIGVDEARQMELFSGAMLPPDPIEDRAFKDGYAHAMLGENNKNPHDPSTAAFRRYEAGYTEGATKVDFLEKDIGAEIVGRAPGADPDDADMFEEDGDED